jgi:2'-5' RNA ligase
MSARPDVQTMRLFYALWPDEVTRRALVRWQPLLQGRLVPAHNLHITLAFLGNQPASLLPSLCTILDRLDATSMLLKLDRPGHFRSSRVAWAGMSVVPQELTRLYETLCLELEALHIRHDRRPQFVPHLTLARNSTGGADTMVEPIEWLADQVALVHSPMNGSPYRLIASKKLTRS